MPSAEEPLAGAVVVLDLDGTLVDTAPDLIGTLNLVLAEHGCAGLPLDAARTLVGHGARRMLEQGFAAAGQRLEAARLDPLYDHFVRIYLSRIAVASRPYPGAREALETLIAWGARLAICTNKPTGLSLALLGELGLAPLFGAVIGPDAAGAAKPDPRHLVAAVEAAGGTMARALMVGDSRTDVETARAAGAPVAAVSFGYSDVPAFELGADVLIDRLADLPAATRRLLAPRRAAKTPHLRGGADA